MRRRKPSDDLWPTSSTTFWKSTTQRLRRAKSAAGDSPRVRRGSRGVARPGLCRREGLSLGEDREDFMIEIESTGVPIKAWVEGVPVEDEAKAQLQSIARLPIVWP